MSHRDLTPTERQRHVGDLIHRVRKKRGWSQDDLAHASGVDRSYLASIETGRRNVTIDLICRLALALGVDAADLVRGAQKSTGRPIKS